MQRLLTTKMITPTTTVTEQGNKEAGIRLFLLPRIRSGYEARRTRLNCRTENPPNPLRPTVIADLLKKSVFVRLTDHEQVLVDAVRSRAIVNLTIILVTLAKDTNKR